MILTEVSEKGKYVTQTICKDGESFAISKPKSLTIGEDAYDDITQLTADDIKAIAKRVTEERLELAVAVQTEKDGTYSFVPAQRTILHTKADGQVEDLGCGAFGFKASVNKKKGIIYKISIEPYTTGDYEIIPHHFNEQENEQEINAFMQKYVFKPYTLSKNVVGVELNFNKEFYVPEQMESVEDIMKELEQLDKDLKKIVL